MDRTLSSATSLDQRTIPIKGYSAFLKAPVLLDPHIKWFSVVNRTLIEGMSYPSAEKQSVYSTAPADWEILILVFKIQFVGSVDRDKNKLNVFLKKM